MLSELPVIQPQVLLKFAPAVPLVFVLVFVTSAKAFPGPQSHVSSDSTSALSDTVTRAITGAQE